MPRVLRTAAILATIMTVGAAGAQEGSGALGNYDRDHDGVISKEEAPGILRSPRFEELDKNGDGKLQPDEIAPAFAERANRARAASAPVKIALQG